MHISREIIKPPDCLVANSMPITEKSWKKNMKTFLDCDFSRKINWPLYQQDTILPYKHLAPIAKNLNANIKNEFSSADFEEYLKNDKLKVIILIAHWNGSAIELFDSFFTGDQFLEICPENKRVIIDLNICNCVEFANCVAPVRTNAMFKRAESDGSCYPGAWFLFYTTFFKLISETNLTYLEALKKNAEHFKAVMNETQR